MVPHARTAGIRDAIDENARGARLTARPARAGPCNSSCCHCGSSALLLSACGSGEDEHARQVEADKAATNDPALIEKGLYMARASDCAACHSTQDGDEYAGGLGFETPVGKIFATNITPDTEHGIGNYTLERSTPVYCAKVRRPMATISIRRCRSRPMHV